MLETLCVLIVLTVVLLLCTLSWVSWNEVLIDPLAYPWAEPLISWHQRVVGALGPELAAICYFVAALAVVPVYVLLARLTVRGK